MDKDVKKVNVKTVIVTETAHEITTDYDIMDNDAVRSREPFKVQDENGHTILVNGNWSYIKQDVVTEDDTVHDNFCE